ncbi:hypothetical protein SASPL_157741 [Salvia splendens]|uniref:Uncharacterized protein n=1 Tax=Salvia splendens TaxID=180675 RepID=A0A8X8VUG2_SALSN|nr:hypothetical protein SASPL_157741 [Salvia splendens]
MGCLFCRNLFTNLGSYKLEDQHSHIPLNPIHYLSLPSWLFGILRLAGTAWISDLAPSGGSKLLFRYRKGWYYWTIHLPGDRMLLAAGAYSSIWRVQELLHQEQWPLQLYRDPLLLFYPVWALVLWIL